MRRGFGNIISDFRSLQRSGRPIDIPPVSDFPKTRCINCGTEFQGRYCPVCGQESDTRQFNTRMTLSSLVITLTGGDSTFWRTATDLLYRPGHMVRDYLNGKRARYFRPVPLLLFLVTVYVLVGFVIDSSYAPFKLLDEDIFQSNIHSQSLSKAVAYLYGLLANKVTFSLIASVVCIFPFKMAFFRCKIQRFSGIATTARTAEHFYTLVYICCINMLVSFFLAALSLIAPLRQNLAVFGTFVPLLAAMWTYRQMYQISWTRSIVNTLVAAVITLAAIIFIIVLSFGLFYGYDALG